LYFFIFLILLTLLDFIKIQSIHKKLILFLVICSLSIIAGLRFGDKDYLNYIKYYEWVKPLNSFDFSELKNVEIGYLLLNSTYKFFGFNYKYVFLTISFLSLFLFFIHVKNYKYRFSALLIYFSHLYLLRDLIQIRAGLAANILLFSLNYLEKRNLMKFLFIVFLASLFHYSALFFILLYMLHPYFNTSKKIIYLIVFGFFIGSILTQETLKLFFLKIGIQRINIYLSDHNDQFQVLGLLNPVLIKNALVVIVMIYFKDKIIEKIKLPYFNLYIFSLSFASFWLATFNSYSLFASRIATFYSSVDMFLIPLIGISFKNRFYAWFITILFSIIAFSAKFEIFKELGFYFL